MYTPSDIQQIEKTYALGKYIIHPQYTNNQALENWIKDLQFEHFENPDNRMLLHSRKRNNLYSFHLPAAGKEVVVAACE